MKLKREFFRRNADVVARELLGKRLVRVLDGGERKSGIINETEAYLGTKDKACHAYGGRRTKRTIVMYKKSGTIYMYFTYGMHWMLNIVCANINNPQAVLIRGLNNISGPARLTKYLEIDKQFNGSDIVSNDSLFIEGTGLRVRKDSIIIAPRIGVDYAGEWKNEKLRYFHILQSESSFAN
jgi:DNA-3-methyladenine glycosylase